MKAVVVEIRDDFAAILSDDGCIVKVTNNNYSMGQVIEMKTAQKPNLIRNIVAAAACIAIFVGAGVCSYALPTTYVSIDVNPSIEYSLNMYDRVLEVKAVNSDGAEVIKKIDLQNLKNKTIDEAIIATVEEISKEGYFEGEGEIVITTSAKDLKKSDELAVELKKMLDNKYHTDKKMQVNAVSVGTERVEEAQKLGITPGKLNLIEKLRDSSEDPEKFIIFDWTEKSVKEISKATIANKQKPEKQEKPEEKEPNPNKPEDKESGQGKPTIKEPNPNKPEEKKPNTIKLREEESSSSEPEEQKPEPKKPVEKVVNPNKPTDKEPNQNKPDKTAMTDKTNNGLKN